MKGAIKIQNITSTYILILTLAATLILAIFGVEKVIRYNCYQNLADAVKQGATNIRSISFRYARSTLKSRHHICRTL